MKRKKNNFCLLQMVLILICLISMGVLFYDMVLVPKQNQELSEQLKGEFLKGDSSLQELPQQAGKKSIVKPVDLVSLKEKYPDVQGWLTIPDTNIDYPVLQGERDQGEFYLKHNYRGEWDANGSLFLQENCEVSESQNYVIYGHNMNSGAMFGNLDRYTAPEYWESHKSVFFQTLQGIREYEIVSVMKVDISMFPFQKVNFQGESGLMDYIKQAKALGLFNTEEICDVPPHIVTLVTCSYEWNGARTVVVAVEKSSDATGETVRE